MNLLEKNFEDEGDNTKSDKEHTHQSNLNSECPYIQPGFDSYIKN